MVRDPRCTITGIVCAEHGPGAFSPNAEALRQNRPFDTFEDNRVYPKGTRPIGLAMKKAAINAAIFTQQEVEVLISGTKSR